MPQTLTIDQCPLLPKGADTDALLSLFNDVVATDVRLRQEYPDLAERLQQIGEQIETIRQRLVRERYRVGFLGTTGVGKSTTFNHLLRVGTEDAPAKSGKGDATTSAIARLIPIQDGNNRLVLRYLTPEQYRQKSEKIIEATQLGVATEDEILEQIPSMINQVKQGKSEGQIEDLEMLRLLLKSRRLHGSALTDPALEETGMPYSRRGEILNHVSHGQTTEPSRYLLLREVEVYFKTTEIPLTLEMIDLPGLGSNGVIDSLLTLDFLNELDGAVVFLRADQLSDTDVEKIIAKLKPSFDQRWSNRIWIITSKFDSLTDDHFREDSPGEGIWFDRVRKFLQKHTLPAQNLHIISNKLHSALQEPSGAAPKEAVAQIKLGRSLDDPIYARYPEFGETLAQTYHDGGIHRLRELLTDGLADAVGAEVRLAAEVNLRRLQTDLKRLEDREQRRRRQSSEELANAKKARNVVWEVYHELAGRPKCLDEPTKELARELEKELESVPKPTFLDGLPNSRALEDEFNTAARDLDRKLRDFSEGKVIDPLYDYVAQRLKEAPAVAVERGNTIQDAWQWFTDEDRHEAASWRKWLPRFNDPDLFDRLRLSPGDAGVLNGNKIHAILQKKQRHAVNQVIHTVRVQLRTRLNSLLVELGALIRQDRV